MNKKNTDIRSLSFGLEVVVVVVVVLALFKIFGVGALDVVEEPKQGEINTPEEAPKLEETFIQKSIRNSEFKGEYVTAEIPGLPSELKLFDISACQEAEVKEYTAGTEYYLTCIYPSMTNFDQIGDYYIQFAEDNEWEELQNIYGINGIQMAFSSKNIEMRPVAIVRMGEDKIPFVLEKTRVFVLK